MNDFTLTNSPENTMQVAKELSGKYKNSLVLLYGELGVGKTHFAKGFARGLGITQTVTSPSYTIINEYRATNKLMYHIDLYRINCFEEVIDLGLFEIIEAQQSCLIEWPNRVEELKKFAHLKVEISNIEGDDENSRRLSWSWNKGLKL